MHCVIWPPRCVGAVFASHVSKLDRPVTLQDYIDFGFEEALKDYYNQNREIVRTNDVFEHVCPAHIRVGVALLKGDCWTNLEVLLPDSHVKR